METIIEPQKKSKTWLWITLIVLLLAGGVYWFMTSDSNTEPVTPPQAILPGDNNSLTVSTQEANRLAVNVDYVSLRAPGFIVIHEDNAGKPGIIAGASALLKEGVHSNVSVFVTPKSGKTYWAMLHTDDGNGVFDPVTDLPATDNSGMVVQTSFGIKTAAPSIPQATPEELKG